jgi:hypothetical protein
MSSTDYSYFNPNNYNSPLPQLTDTWNNLSMDFRMLPLYTVNGTQLMTYFLLGVTAVTLGYVTIKEDTEKPSEEKEPSEEPKMGGKKKKSRITKKNKK